MDSTAIKTTAFSLLHLFFIITFFQSAWDKLSDRKGNLEFFTSHFGKSPLAPFAGLLLTALTLVELASSIFGIYGLIRLFLSVSFVPTLCALGAYGINLLMLLFGQRMAKDYAGASTIGIYFALLMTGFLLL